MKVFAAFLTVCVVLSFSFSSAFASYAAWKSCFSEAKALALDGRTQEALKEAKLSVLESKDRHGRQTLNTVKSLELFAELTRETGNYSRAIKYQREAYEIVSRLRGKTDPNTIGALCKLAGLTILNGNLKTGKGYYDEAVLICKNGNRSECITAAEPMIGLAQVLATEGKLLDAEKLYLSAIAKFRLFSKYQPELKLKMAAALENLGAIYRSQGDYTSAVKCFDQSRSVYQSLKATPEAQDGLCLSLLNLGDTYAGWGKHERAIKSYKEASVIMENHPDADSSMMLGLVLKSLGDTYKNKGNMLMAANYYKKAVVRFETIAFVGNPLFLETVKCLAKVYKGMGMDSDAQAIEAKTLAMR
ncbi:MAG: tetratricopeptide repeat protein [Desulfomonilaceae bacterium]